MPSTARVTIAQQDTTKVVTESLDHVWNTQYGRHDTLSLAAATSATVNWPTTGETFVYLVIIVPGATGGDLTLTAVGATGGWLTTLPPGSIRTPILLPKPKTATGFTLLSTVAAECSMVFF
jgi:hypothetical protein